MSPPLRFVKLPSLSITILSLITACGGSSAPAHAPPASGQAATAPSAGGAAASGRFAEPEPLPLGDWIVLGPFDNPPGENGKPRQGFERDLLASLGGEASARLGPDTSLELEGGRVASRSARADAAGIVDLVKLYGEGTDLKVAYAYAELKLPEAATGYAQFGSDDAAAVWVNGRQLHRVVQDRAVDPSSDQFEVPLARGTNRILVKVDNGGGGWAFALRLYDAAGKEQLQALETRRHLYWLDPGPITDHYLLDSSFPEMIWRSPKGARAVFGDNPLRVRWFDPGLNEVDAPRADGRYIAVLEAETLDGYTHRHMLTFAKVPHDTMPWFPAPPHGGIPTRLELPPNLKLNPAQAREFERHVWAAGGTAMWRSEHSAILALSLLDLADSSRSEATLDELDNGYIRAEEAQLALRLKLEGRTPVPLPPPEGLDPPAPVLRPGSEAQAGMKPGSVARLRALAKEWAKADPSEFVVLVARRGVIVMHEGFNGFDKDAFFYPASIGKTVAGLTFARAVDQGLFSFDQPIADVLPDWKAEHTRAITFRHCFSHITGLSGHRGHGGLFNPYLDSALFVQDGLFIEPGRAFIYNGNALNLVAKALELKTGQSAFRILYEQLQQPFGEPVRQFDFGVGDHFNALYLAKLGQMLIQDGAYGAHRFYKPGFVGKLWPKRVADFAPTFEDQELESGIGLGWMTDPPGPRERGALGPDVVGHGAASGVTFRIARDQELVIVVGRNKFENWQLNEEWGSKFVIAVAENLAK